MSVIAVTSLVLIPRSESYSFPMCLELRPANYSDWAAYRQLRLTMLADSPAAFDEQIADATARDEQGWQVTTRSKLMDDSCWFVASAGQQLVGQAQGRRYGSRCYLLEVFVLPQARGKGLADALISLVAQWASSVGFTELWLDVAETQQAALRRYISLGFSPTGKREPHPLFADISQLEMVKPLNEADTRKSPQP